MSEVPSSTALETLSYMLWLLIEPLEATLSVYNPWTVVIFGLLLGFAPLPRHLIYAKVLATGILAYAAYMFRPVIYQLGPIWPAPYEAETYIRIGIVMIESGLMIAAVQFFTDAIKALKDMTGKTHTSPVQASLAFNRPFDMTDRAKLNFTAKVATPVSRALTQTLSVPYSQEV